jgi:hypothetical protein
MPRVLANEFSWSKSRHEKFEECLRAYYLYYYASWGGWEVEAPAEARELYLLKKLSNRFTWAGGVVHDAVKDALLDLRAGRPVVPERMLERAHRQMREDFVHSRRHGYRERKLRKQFLGLSEHEYQEPIADTEWKRVWESAKEALNGFLSSRWPSVAKSLRPHEWLEVDEGALHSQLEHHGVRFFAIPDFAYQEPSGDVVVVDWKTGQQREGYDEQVTGYALYLSTRYRVPVEKVRAVLVYLNAGVEKESRVTPERVEQFEALFSSSVAKMRALLVDAQANRPQPKDAFPMTENRQRCAFCVFRRVCGRAESLRPAA